MSFKLFLNLFCLLRSVCALRRQVVIKRDGLTYDVDVDSGSYRMVSSRYTVNEDSGRLYQKIL